MSLRAIAALRRGGKKPRLAMVFLVAEASTDAPAIGPRGGISVDIPRSASVADLDFRPLAGLSVQLHDMVGDADRMRAVSKAIVAVNPALFVAFTERDGKWTMHRRIAGDPPKHGSYAL